MFNSVIIIIIIINHPILSNPPPLSIRRLPALSFGPSIHLSLYSPPGGLSYSMSSSPLPACLLASLSIDTTTICATPTHSSSCWVSQKGAEFSAGTNHNDGAALRRRHPTTFAASCFATSKGNLCMWQWMAGTSSRVGGGGEIHKKKKKLYYSKNYSDLIFFSY